MDGPHTTRTSSFPTPLPSTRYPSRGRFASPPRDCKAGPASLRTTRGRKSPPKKASLRPSVHSAPMRKKQGYLPAEVHARCRTSREIQYQRRPSQAQKRRGGVL